jgi:hypothetical protein
VSGEVICLSGMVFTIATAAMSPDLFHAFASHPVYMCSEVNLRTAFLASVNDEKSSTLQSWQDAIMEQKKIGSEARQSLLMKDPLSALVSSVRKSYPLYDGRAGNVHKHISVRVIRFHQET